jgi:hypothetical protein
MNSSVLQLKERLETVNHLFYDLRRSRIFITSGITTTK